MCDCEDHGQPTKPKTAEEEVLNHLSEVIYQRSWKGAEVQSPCQRKINKTLDNIKPFWIEDISQNDNVQVTALEETKTGKSEHKEVIETCCGVCGNQDSVQVAIQDKIIKDVKTSKPKHVIVGKTCENDNTAQDKVIDKILREIKNGKPKLEGENIENYAELADNGPQFYEAINKTLAEVVKARVETEAKASRLNRLKNKYNNQAINLLEKERQELRSIREIQLRASSTRETRAEHKKAGKQRTIRSILRKDEFLTRAENRDKAFEEKKREEEKKDRERLLRAANKPMPPSKFSRRLQAILSFAGSSLLLAGIIGLLYKCVNITGMKTAVDNVFTAIAEGSGSSKRAQGAWSFEPGGTFDPHSRPRDTGGTCIKISEDKIKYPEAKPPKQFTIPGFHGTDEDDEGDFNLGGNLDFDEND